MQANKKPLDNKIYDFYSIIQRLSYTTYVDTIQWPEHTTNLDTIEPNIYCQEILFGIQENRRNERGTEREREKVRWIKLISTR